MRKRYECDEQYIKHSTHTHFIMTPKLSIVFMVMSSAILLGAVFSIPVSHIALAQDPFDITTEQSAADQQAIITVRIATNNTIVIPTNGSIIEVPGNVTSIDNDTVIVTPDNDTISELPGNVTVISPPEPECQCPTGNETAAPPAEEEPLAPVLVTPAPGQNVTIQNATVVETNETGIVVEGQGNETTPTTEEPVPFPPAPDTNITAPPAVEPEPQPTDEEGNATESMDDGGINATTADTPTASFLSLFGL